MPTVDASQFTRFKRANAVNRSDTQVSDPKSANGITSYTIRLSDTASLLSFLPNPSVKSAQPITQTPKLILGKIGLLHQRCG